MKEQTQDYLSLVEEYEEKKPYNAFEKILVASSRAKDLQQVNAIDKKHYNFAYMALEELNSEQIMPTVRPKDTSKIQDDDES